MSRPETGRTGESKREADPMKAIQILPIGLLLALGTACASSKTYPDVREQYGENPMESPEFQAKMMEYAAPSDPHKQFARQTGRWNVTGKMFMTPGAPATPMNASANIQMLLDGRYMMEEFKSEFMGMPFEGVLLMGYNNMTEEYSSIWMDNMGTGWSPASGVEVSDGVVEMKGTMTDLISPGGRAFRHVATHHDDGTFSVVMYDTLPDGEEWKVMEMHYSR